MVGPWIEVVVGMGLLPVNLMGEGTIVIASHKDISEGKGVVLFNFHGKLYVRRMAIEVIKERN